MCDDDEQSLDNEGDITSLHGDHLGYDGGIHPFVMKNPHLRGQLVNDLHHVAGVQFETHFGGRDVGWEDMLHCLHSGGKNNTDEEQQNKLWIT